MSKQSELDRRIDAALADPARHRIASHWTAGDVEMVQIFFCNIVNGRCDVCLSDKPGGKGCISITMPRLVAEGYCVQVPLPKNPDAEPGCAMKCDGDGVWWKQINGIWVPDERMNEAVATMRRVS